MKHYIHNLYAATVLLLPILFSSACNSVTPARFHRYYSPADGACTEVISYNGVASENKYAQTNLAKLFAKYPEAKAPQNSVKSGAYFYFVQKEDTGAGSSTGDEAERAAFLLLDMEDDYARGNALKIRDYLLADDVQGMHALYEKITAKAGVKEERTFPDKEAGKTQSYLREFKIGANGARISHGLTRVFYEDGMIAGDTFYRNGKQEGPAHKYNRDCSIIR